MRTRFAVVVVLAAAALAACSSDPSTDGQVPVAPPRGGDEAGWGGGGGQQPAPTTGGGLVGVWAGETIDILGYPAVVETVLQPNGRFSQTTHSSGDPIWITGTYRTIDTGTIRFTIEDHSRQWCGPLECQPLYFQEAETVFFEFADPDTLVTWGYQDPTRSVHRRVG